jgi:hypothetical protein
VSTAVRNGARVFQPAILLQLSSTLPHTAGAPDLCSLHLHTIRPASTDRDLGGCPAAKCFEVFISDLDQ